MHTETELLEIAREAAVLAWSRFVKLYPRVGEMPSIIFNRRLKTTAGRCSYTEREIDLSPSLMAENIREFKEIIIPHELAHMVAWDIYKDGGHGPDWKSVMLAYGIPAERCHSLSSAESRQMAANRQSNKLRKIAAEIVVGDVVTFVHTNRQRVKTDITGKVIKVNLKTIKMVSRADGREWTVPKENTCNLRHA